MKTKQDIINEIASERLVESIINKYSQSPYRDDLAQDIYIELLSKDDALIQRLYENNQIEFYIRKMIRLNLNSSTSRFYRSYIKFRKITSDINEEKKI